LNFVSVDLLNAAIMNTLSNAEAIHISTVLEDCIDQLIILGRIMPVPYQKRPDAEQVCIQYSESLSLLFDDPELAVNCLRTDHLQSFN